MSHPIVYVWIEKVQPEGCTFSAHIQDIWNALPQNQENKAYLAEIVSPSQPPVVISQRVTALGCFLQIMHKVAPQLLPKLTLHRDEDHRPYVTFGEDAPAVSFSLTHTQDMVGCAVYMGCEKIGIDIEGILPRDRAIKISQRFFTKGEQAWLRHQPAIPLAVTQIWTSKEAMFKCGDCEALTWCDVAQPTRPTYMMWGILEEKNVITLCTPMPTTPRLLYAPATLVWSSITFT